MVFLHSIYRDKNHLKWFLKNNICAKNTTEAKESNNITNLRTNLIEVKGN